MAWGQLTEHTRWCCLMLKPSGARPHGVFAKHMPMSRYARAPAQSRSCIRNLVQGKITLHSCGRRTLESCVRSRRPESLFDKTLTTSGALPLAFISAAIKNLGRAIATLRPMIDHLPSIALCLLTLLQHVAFYTQAFRTRWSHNIIVQETPELSYNVC